MCVCVNVDPVACKAERYGYTVEEYQGEPCGCACHIFGIPVWQPNNGLQSDGDYCGCVWKGDVDIVDGKMLCISCHRPRR